MESVLAVDDSFCRGESNIVISNGAGSFNWSLYCPPTQADEAEAMATSRPATAGLQADGDSSNGGGAIVIDDPATSVYTALESLDELLELYPFPTPPLSPQKETPGLIPPTCTASSQMAKDSGLLETGHHLETSSSVVNNGIVSPVSLAMDDSPSSPHELLVGTSTPPQPVIATDGVADAEIPDIFCRACAETNGDVCGCDALMSELLECEQLLAFEGDHKAAHSRSGGDPLTRHTTEDSFAELLLTDVMWNGSSTIPPNSNTAIVSANGHGSISGLDTPAPSPSSGCLSSSEDGGCTSDCPSTGTECEEATTCVNPSTVFPSILLPHAHAQQPTTRIANARAVPTTTKLQDKPVCESRAARSTMKPSYESDEEIIDVVSYDAGATTTFQPHLSPSPLSSSSPSTNNTPSSLSSSTTTNNISASSLQSSSSSPSSVYLNVLNGEVGGRKLSTSAHGHGNHHYMTTSQQHNISNNNNRHISSGQVATTRKRPASSSSSVSHSSLSSLSRSSSAPCSRQSSPVSSPVKRRRHAKAAPPPPPPPSISTSPSSTGLMFHPRRRSSSSCTTHHNQHQADVTESDDEQRRASHNVLERKRRNDLKYSFQLLRVEVPELEDNQRAPKVVILRKAAEHIRHMQQQTEAQEKVLTREKNRRDQLLERIHQLCKCLPSSTPSAPAALVK